MTYFSSIVVRTVGWTDKGRSIHATNPTNENDPKKKLGIFQTSFFTWINCIGGRWFAWRKRIWTKEELCIILTRYRSLSSSCFHPLIKFQSSLDYIPFLHLQLICIDLNIMTKFIFPHCSHCWIGFSQKTLTVKIRCFLHLYKNSYSSTTEESPAQWGTNVFAKTQESHSFLPHTDACTLVMHRIRNTR